MRYLVLQWDRAEVCELVGNYLFGKLSNIIDKKSWFICGALRNLVPFVQFKKREKHP